MKRLWVSTALILALAGLCALHVSTLSRVTHQLTGQLDQARKELIQGQWEQAQSLVQEASQEWERHGFYLHTTLRHTDLDAIRSGFQEALAYLSAREDASECAAVCARMINQLELIQEAELPTIHNLM
ncbi:MAG TPA: DUF4363 family protein [Candidatus Enterenecus merdae]|nr:DUF4363 family protein [Candidatus Enterenecus merdae]